MFLFNDEKKRSNCDRDKVVNCAITKRLDSGKGVCREREREGERERERERERENGKSLGAVDEGRE